MDTALILANSVTGLQWNTGSTTLTTRNDTQVLNESSGAVYWWTNNPSSKTRMAAVQTFPQQPVAVTYSFANNDGASAPQITLTVTGKPTEGR